MNDFLKYILHRINRNTKIFKNLFETIKKKAKKIYYSNKLVKYTGNIKKKKQKKTWDVIKDIIEKSKIKSTKSST